jgi:RNA polymerase sigma-70 factor (ECF subfamily)
LDVEKTLVAEAAAGSGAAFDELVRRSHARIYNLTRVLTGGDADAEDLVQDTFIRAFRALPRFRGESSFRTWLHRIAVNVIRSHMVRRSRTIETAAVRDSGKDSDSLFEQVPSEEDLEAAVTRRQIIDRALATLAEDVRLLITLRDVEGLEYQEIAAVTGLPIGTVESRIFRARQRLRPLLESLIVGPRAGQGVRNARRGLQRHAAHV